MTDSNLDSKNGNSHKPKGNDTAGNVSSIFNDLNLSDSSAVDSENKKSKSKIKKIVSSGIVHIRTTFNNVIVTVTDLLGNTLSWSSSGSCGFKGSKKCTPWAAAQAAKQATKDAIDKFGLRAARIEISGPGAGRDAAINSVSSLIEQIPSIRDKTKIPRNGVRPPKRRRM